MNSHPGEMFTTLEIGRPALVPQWSTPLASVSNIGLAADESRPMPGLGPPFHIGGKIVYGPQPFSELEPSMTFDGTNYFVAWNSEDHRGDHVCGARVNASGEVIDSLAIRIYSSLHDAYTVNAASNGESYLVVWVEWCTDAGCPDIYGVRVSASGAVLDSVPIVISDAYGYQMSPHVGSDGTDYLVAWDDTRDGDDEKIYATRVSASGTVLDPDGFRLSPSAATHRNPNVAFDGTDYMVLWQGGPGFLGTRVSPDGTVLDPGGVPMAGPGGGGLEVVSRSRL